MARALATAAAEGRVSGLGPDGVAQVAIRYEDQRPAQIDAVTVEVAGLAGADAATPRFARAVVDDVVRPTLAATPLALAPDAALLVNPNGPPEPGGPNRHTGLTGRKLAVDTYGGFARHPGSALSGKDPWRIDRTATYAARRAAKLVVAAGLGRRCEVQLSYSSDQAGPTSVQVDTFGGDAARDATIAGRLRDVVDLRPAAIAQDLRLVGPGRVRLPDLAAYGQVGGANRALPWEDVAAASLLVG